MPGLMPPSSLDLAAVRAAVNCTLQMPAVPHVVRRLIVHLRQPDVSTHTLVAEIEQDPVIAARTLRMANSPHFGGRRQVGSVRDAVQMVGENALRTLVISGGFDAVFSQVKGVNLRQFWTEATQTARASRLLARAARLDAEAAYLAGLLHATGHLILCTAHPAEMAPLLVDTVPLRGMRLAHAERQACGLSYPEVGAAWVESLGFPLTIVDGVAHHLMPQTAMGELAAVVHLAQIVSTAVDAGASAEEAAAQLPPHVTSLLGQPDAVLTAALVDGYALLMETEPA